MRENAVPSMGYSPIKRFFIRLLGVLLIAVGITFWDALTVERMFRDSVYTPLTDADLGLTSARTNQVRGERQTFLQQNLETGIEASQLLLLLGIVCLLRTRRKDSLPF